MCEHTDDVIVAIPDWNLDAVDKELDKLNKRARKIGVPEVSYEVVREYQIPAPGYEKQAKIAGLDNVPQVTMMELKILGEGPKIDGWKFIGTLDHNSIPGSIIVNTVPGESIPKEIRESDAWCDHCGKVRRRNETFVLVDEEGDHQRVGRQCVREFIGYDPAQVLAFLTRLRKVVSGFDEERWGGGGSYREYIYDKDRVLLITAAVIDRYGWVPRSSRSEDKTPTADQVSYTLNPPFGSRERRDWEEWRATLDLDNPRFLEEATKAREWLNENTDDNDYLHNLRMIEKGSGVPHKLFGYWCSLVSTYLRHEDRLRMAAQTKKLNEHVPGNVKDRVELTVTVTRKSHTNGYYGSVTIYNMLDSDGRTVVWFANTNAGMDLDKTYQIKGTIKSFGDYKGWSQTILTRVKKEKECE